MAKRYLIFICFIYTCLSDEYINMCFDNLDRFGEKVNLMVNKKLSFFPELIEISTGTDCNTYINTLKRQETASYIMRKSKFPCHDPFIYAVPWDTLPLQTVFFTLKYEYTSFLIDEFMTAVKPNFTENAFDMLGLLGRVRMNVVLMHETFSKINPSEPKKWPWEYYHVDNKVPRRRKGQIYCMAFLTIGFSNILAFKKIQWSFLELYKYNIMTVITYKNGERFLENDRRFLIKIYPCNVGTFLKKRLKIIIDPSITKLVFKIKDFSHKYDLKTKYMFKNGKAYWFEPFDLNHIHLYIIQKPITRGMVNKRKNMVLYFSKTKRIPCPVRLPENFDKLKLSFVEIHETESRVVYKKGRFVDYSSKDFQVFNLKPGRPSEDDLCNIEEM